MFGRGLGEMERGLGWSRTEVGNLGKRSRTTEPKEQERTFTDGREEETSGDGTEARGQRQAEDTEEAGMEVGGAGNVGEV